jgi:hypothetical protein
VKQPNAILDERQRRKRRRVGVGLVSVLALAGVLTFALLPTPPATHSSSVPSPGASLIAAYSDAPKDEAAASAAGQVVATKPRPGLPTLHPKDAEFDRLTAPNATPAMLSRAFELAKDCKNEATALAGGVQTSPLSAHRCQLPPGKWQDPATVKRMLEARVQRADFGAWVDVAMERTGAFADDPARWRQLVAEAYNTGKAKSEPTVMKAEAGVLLDRAEALHAAGQLAEAKEAYRQAAAFAVASAIGTGWENKQTQVDLAADKSVQAIWPKLAAAERKEAITAGKALAQNWRKPS